LAPATAYAPTRAVAHASAAPLPSHASPAAATNAPVPLAVSTNPAVAESFRGGREAAVNVSATTTASEASAAGVALADSHLQRWFVAGRDAEGHPHTAYLDAPDRDSAFAAAVARGLKDVTSIEQRQRPHD